MEFELMEKYNEIIEWLTQYREHTNCRGVVLGISGGKDSTVVAMLAKKVWGDNVFGVLMPNGEQKDLSDAKSIAHQLGLRYGIVNIGTTYNALISAIEVDEDMDSNGLPLPSKNIIDVSEKSKTNIPPRLRMTTLYAIALSMGYRVIGTGNLSEGFIGWCTKWGDCAYDLNPIAHLTCTEVIELGLSMCGEFGLDEKYVQKTPSDGLTGKSDEDNFGFTYAELDSYISGCGFQIPYETAEKIERLHKASEHKRNMPATIG